MTITTRFHRLWLLHFVYKAPNHELPLSHMRCLAYLAKIDGFSVPFKFYFSNSHIESPQLDTALDALLVLDSPFVHLNEKDQLRYISLTEMGVKMVEGTVLYSGMTQHESYSKLLREYTSFSQAHLYGLCAKKHNEQFRRFIASNKFVEPHK